MKCRVAHAQVRGMQASMYQLQMVQVLLGLQVQWTIPMEMMDASNENFHKCTTRNKKRATDDHSSALD